MVYLLDLPIGERNLGRSAFLGHDRVGEFPHGDWLKADKQLVNRLGLRELERARETVIGPAGEECAAVALVIRRENRSYRAFDLRRVRRQSPRRHPGAKRIASSAARFFMPLLSGHDRGMVFRSPSEKKHQNSHNARERDPKQAILGTAHCRGLPITTRPATNPENSGSGGRAIASPPTTVCENSPTMNGARPI